MGEIKYSFWHSPLGWIGLAANARGMVAITVPRGTRRAAQEDLRFRIASPAQEGENTHIRATRVELERYFKRDPRADFEHIKLDFQCGTPFEREVWHLLRRIPYGQTCTYGELARACGRPRAARAVGQCNARNPWAIVVPCHRVVGTDAGLTGYAGGLELKRQLLELEGIRVTALRAKRLAAARQRRRRNAHRN